MAAGVIRRGARAVVAAFMITLLLFLLFPSRKRLPWQPVPYCEVPQGMWLRFGDDVYDYDHVDAYLPCRLMPLQRPA